MNAYVEEYTHQINLIMRIIMHKSFKLLTSSFIIALTLATPQLIHASIFEQFEQLLDVLKSKIIIKAAIDQCSDDKGPGNLALVCRKWREIVQEDVNKKEPIWKAWYGVLGNEEVYRTFLNGKLIYRPTPESDDGSVALDFKRNRPFEGAVDLSACGDIGKFLVITTSLSNFFALHPDQLVIGIFPRFLVKKKITTTASPFEGIMKEWDEASTPAGIFWRWGSWDLKWFDYLTQSTLADISSRNLYDNWSHCGSRHAYLDLPVNHPNLLHRGSGKFHVCF